MDINKQNYEEFFLLYIDNELSEQEKIQVNLFVLQHPELQAELESLQAVTLPASNKEVLMPNKQYLYKNAHQLVNEHNYENYFLLYIDNALLPNEKLAVEQFVANNPIYQTAFEALLATKLPIENIPFTNKQLLYKNTTKVIPLFHWQKWVAAAVIVGFISTLWIVDWQKPEKPVDSTVQQVEKPNNGSNKNDLIEKETPNKIAVSNNNSVAQNAKNTNPKNNAPQNNAALVTHNGTELSTSNIEQPIASTINHTSATHSAVANNQVNASNHTTLPNKTIEYTATENSSIANNSVPVANAIVATSNTSSEANVYRELNTDSDNKSLYIGALEINKDKLRGVTRKIASFFSKKVKKEEENIKEAFAVN
jgi:hypothetical protein